MIEWAILVVLVPLVLVPVVLLLGFAGCEPFGAPSESVDAPTNLVATAVGEDQIDLAWEHSSMGGVTFIVAEAGPDGIWNDNAATTTEKALSRKNLAAGVTFSYRVRARSSTGTESGTSNAAVARTFKWHTAYDKPLTDSDAVFQGDCLVQRLDRAVLVPWSGSVKRVRLTLRGSASASGDPLLIDRISISHAAPPNLAGNPQPDAWDSEPPLAVRQDPGPLPGDGTAVALEVDFPMAANKDLIVAFDISASNGTQTRRLTSGVGASACFINGNAAEALVENRSPTGWATRPGMVYLVEKIEVLTV